MPWCDDLVIETKSFRFKFPRSCWKIRYKDYQRGHRLCTLTLEAVEFLRRLMLHVPPHGFHRLRHFGFLANRVRQEKLAQCRSLLGQATRPPAQQEAVDLKTPAVSAAEPGSVCPVCQHGRMQRIFPSKKL